MKNDTTPGPEGILSLQTVAMPADTNPNGDIFGGWLLSQMDLAGAILARRRASGRVTTVAVGEMNFLRPVPMGATVSCYSDIIETGRSSMKVSVQVWISPEDSPEQRKVTEGEFVYVAIDTVGNTRAVPKDGNN